MPAPLPSTPNHSRFEVLDGMRGVAAISVMLFHFPNMSYPFFRNGFIAVDLFFMLSGFVLAYSYGARLQSNMGYFEYILKRIIRLYPMFLLGIVIGAPVLYLVAKSGLATCSIRSIAGSIFYNFMFLPDINSFNIREMGVSVAMTGEIFPANPPAWSLFFEMVAGFAFPFLFKLKQKNLVRITLFSFSAFLLCGFVDAFLNYCYALDLSGGWRADNFMEGFPRVFFGFPFGILLYSLIEDTRLDKLRAVAGRWISHPYILYLLIIFVCASPHEVKGLYSVFIIAVVAPCLVCVGAAMSCKGSISVKVARFLGWMSYPIYCLHYPIGRAVYLLSEKAH
ncbi:MAG TPA: acyltransferase, partial [Acidocella sp.]|nr:acyltransferase [Acidocella sp.]